MPRTVPDDPSVQDMIVWIGETFSMTRSELARMFETTPTAISAWIEKGVISEHQFAKLRRSFYFLHSAPDPHFNERKCGLCRRWKSRDAFNGKKSVCLDCGGHRKNPGS